MKDIQNNGSSFEALVALSTLKTQVDQVAVSKDSDIDPPELNDIIAVQPPVRIPEETQPFDDGSDSECDNPVEEIILRSDLEEYIQPTSAETHPSRILADVFH